MVRGRTAHPRVSLDINPSSRQILENLIRHGYIGPLIHAGARLHQAGCNGCIGMGQAPATDTISPAGARALPFRSNIAQIAKFSYDIVDGTYHDRAMAVRAQGGHAIVGGRNYGQGSSREHAALAPRSLGLHLVIAKGVARIHWQNLVNFGVLPLTFMDPADYDRLEQGDVIRVESIHAAITSGPTIPVKNLTRKLTFVARHSLSDRQVDVYMAGGLINWKKGRL